MYIGLVLIVLANYRAMPSGLYCITYFSKKLNYLVNNSDVISSMSKGDITQEQIHLH